ncbi:polyubiquitin [Nicotiana tabacum]|uniref:Polyubiquitin n=2 Tax=Nicotiana TaxID=4085 RepID=A0A1S4BB15_TOBAC|nr:PREDICTED: polyubiquitin 8 [Nicotiana sylvestris]XP_016486067.1 PREDICTED: polyubiquitin 8 [Nicotiana tabacum]
MNITIVMGESEFSMEVSPQESILETKQKIENLLGVPVASQNLSVFGFELLDGLYIQDYPISTQGTKIRLTIFQNSNTIAETSVQQIENFQIIVKISARKINIDIDRTETVRSLKEKIHIVDGTPIRRMALYFSGNELNDDYRSLIEYGVQEFSEIIVFLKTVSRMVTDPPSRGLNLVVQTSSSLLNAAKIPVEMSDLGTVNDLRQLLLDRTILPMDDYIFIHKQRIMRDSCSLRWHGVENGDFVYVFKGSVSREAC